jgi:S-formylglutathione hydrolase FrmB
LFGASGSTSGGVDIRPFPNNWEIKKALGEYEKNKSVWDENTVNTLVEWLRKDQLKIIIDCGLDDFFLKVNRSLHEKLQALKIDHDYIERPGEHNANYWKNSIDYQLLFFKKYFDSSN